MAYTIKGLAKANDCKSFDRLSLAEVWAYWIENNNSDMQSVKDFKRLRKKDRKEMMALLRVLFPKVANHILDRIDF